MKIFVLLFIILIPLSWAKEKKEIDVPINIGVGPAFFWIPGVMGKELHPGAKLDLYAVITPQMLQENENKIPKKYKKYVNMNEEMHMTPFWMTIIPKYLIINPQAENYIYGGLWSILGISNTFFKSKSIKLEGELILPTISYLYTTAPKNDPNTQHLFGIGAMARLENTIKFNKKFLASLAYGHNLNILPIGNTYKEEDSATEQQWLQAGVLSLVFHYRFNVKQKI